MKYLIVLISLSSLLFNACSKTDNDGNENEDICYEFDQRQCGTDEWALQVTALGAPTPWETNMKNYLEGKGMSVNEVIIDYNYHEFVCEACDICPMEYRFFVKFDPEDLSILEGLNLLNLGAINCDDIF